MNSVKKWAIENWFKLGILVAVLLVAASPAYYFFSYLPRQNADAQLMKDLDKSYQAQQLQNCLDTADNNYNDLFTKDCKLEARDNCDTNPTLSVSMVEVLQKDRDNQKDFCFKQYPSN